MEDGEGYSGKVPQGNFHTTPLVVSLTIPPSRRSATHLPKRPRSGSLHTTEALSLSPRIREKIFRREIFEANHLWLAIST